MIASRPLLLLPLCAALLWAVGSGLTQLAHGAAATIGVESIRPGMKGYGLTVFRGTVPERFDVEVIDVLHNFRPSQDMILVRTGHPVLDKAIVVGGMSGSPVYLDGRLAGAYAYGWTFGKEPVAGVTPIANMLTELARPIDDVVLRALGAQPFGKSPAAGANGPVARARTPRPTTLTADLGVPAPTPAEGPFAALRRHAEHSGISAEAPSEGARLTPLATPLMLSGFSPGVVELLDRELGPFGLPAVEASAGAASATANNAAARYVDGGAIGVQLVSGDVQATAVGTVTHVAGQRLIAFGHPMMNAGQPALPTATARVLHVLANERRSFKIAELLTPLGALIHDRQSAIVVDTALVARTIPLRVRVHGVPGAPRTEWNMQLASHRLLTPMLAFAAAQNALSATVAEQTDVMFESSSKVRVEGHGTIELRDPGYTPIGVASPMALGRLRAFSVIAAAFMNPFEQARLEGIEIDLKLAFGRDELTILDAMAPATTVDPGRSVNVYVTLRRYAGELETKVIPVFVPFEAAGEKIEVSFESGTSVQLELPKPENLAQIFDNVQKGYPATSMVVSTKLPGQGLSMRGHVVHSLPGSMLDTLQGGGSSDQPTAFSTQTRTELPMSAVITGSAKVKLEVRTEPLR